MLADCGGFLRYAGVECNSAVIDVFNASRMSERRQTARLTVLCSYVTCEACIGLRLFAQRTRTWGLTVEYHKFVTFSLEAGGLSASDTVRRTPVDRALNTNRVNRQGVPP